ncbi:30S ribosomal protein S30 [Ameyamaea chiangmaiensis NBRC 103196]|uniref:Ribosome hibernation promoting factor n=1 Tax=Ameyamaea chiangmaiensis TaxID=442969 RepID=A0A850PH14_9PROT|nr:ribosome-associated translation inhibitor RaiA [Ameyamaea chiangmaiensis]MBS4073908.1 ribosome-associated translation inhibitor RaiA [Ameyamaea chiangmaiensis]NVN41526.1 ribosome-associated translation inhibitor RaiA [Ameyamaea chiangmaiensis]GBQ67978.1 30S ribosomal protein S30 [Ameyamaea chiangmaiensis NBRC 103196]
MDIQVSGKQIDLSDALKTRVATNLDAIAGKYFGQALDAQVTFSRARSFFLCDINLHAGPGLVLRGEGEASDASSAFDDAAEHMAKRLRRYRRRLNDNARSRSSSRTQTILRARERIFANGTDPDGLDALDQTGAGDLSATDTSTGGGASAIIAEQVQNVAMLTVGEAAMRLDLSGEQILMFRNPTTRQTNVVYRRPDGHVGWIDLAAEA